LKISGLLSGRKARGIWQAALWSLPFPAFSREFLLIYEDLQMLHFYTAKTIFSFTSKRKTILSFAFSMVYSVLIHNKLALIQQKEIPWNR
jgi:hypothetical protein